MFRKSQTFWIRWGPVRPLGWKAWPTPRNTNFSHKWYRANLLVLSQMVQRRAGEIGPSRPAFQGHLIKTIETDTDRSAAYDFLLVIHSNHYRFRNKRWLRSKISHFPTLVYLMPPLTGFPFEFCNDSAGLKSRVMPPPEGRKSLRICAFV